MAEAILFHITSYFYEYRYSKIYLVVSILPVPPGMQETDISQALAR